MKGNAAHGLWLGFAAVALAGCTRQSPELGVALTAEQARFAERMHDAYFAPRDMHAAQVEFDLAKGKPPRIESLVVQNIGDTDIDALWLYANDDFNLYSADTMMAGVEQGDAEAAVARIMELRRRHFKHHPPITTSGFPHDPAALFGALGYGICDDISIAAARLGRCRGLDMATCAVRMDRVGRVKLAKPLEHSINLLRIGDKVVPLDFDQGMVWRNAQGELASLDAIARDPQLVSGKPYDWVHEGHNVSEIMADWFVANAPTLTVAAPKRKPSREHRMRLCLPMGAEFEWDYAEERNMGEGVLRWDIGPAAQEHSHYVRRPPRGLLVCVLSPYRLIGGMACSARGWVCERLVEWPESVPRQLRWSPFLPAEGEQSAAGLWSLGQARPIGDDVQLGMLVKVPTGGVRLDLLVHVSNAALPRLVPGRNVVHVVSSPPVGDLAVRIGDEGAVVIESKMLRVTLRLE